MKKTLFALTAAALMATALSVPASAGTIGCEVGNPINASANATNCPSGQANAAQPAAKSAFAYVAPSHTIVSPTNGYAQDQTDPDPFIRSMLADESRGRAGD